MIRQVQLSGVDKADRSKLMIKRKFIPIALTMKGTGDYITFKEKLPFNTRKLVGVIITCNAPGHKALGNRVYFGNGPGGQYNQAFIEQLPWDLAKGQSQTYHLVVSEDQYLYYAQPKRLGCPTLKINDQKYRFKDPRTLGVQGCEAMEEEYRAWKSKHHSLGNIRLEILQEDDYQDREDYDGDDDDCDYDEYDGEDI